jgi:hypothetical protein
MRVDYCLYNSRGDLVAAVEAKRQAGTSEKWAAQFRRNLLAHQVLMRAPFFLIVTSDRIYLWKQPDRALDDADDADRLPDASLDARSNFQPYFEKIGVNSRTVDPLVFETLVGSWLRDLMRHTEAVQELENQSLAGFVKAIQGGRLVYEQAA